MALLARSNEGILPRLKGDAMRAAKKACGDALRTGPRRRQNSDRRKTALSTDELVAIMLAAPAAKAKADREAAEMAALEAEIAAEEALKPKRQQKPRRLNRRESPPAKAPAKMTNAASRRQGNVR